MKEEIDGLLPSTVADKVEDVGIEKAKMDFTKTFMLALLAGSFIGFGAIFATTVTADSNLSFGITKLIGGVAFSLGLILVIVTGAELFTGNNLISMAWASGKIKPSALIRNWMIVYLGNIIGAVFLAGLMMFAEQYTYSNGAIGLNALNIADAKCNLGFVQAISLGILCNILVCLAVWLCFSARSIADKVLVIIFPITAFVAAGFEHSIANMYFIPKGLFIKIFADEEFWTSIDRVPTDFQHLTWNNFLIYNLLPVTIGNIIGGAVLVGLVYWFIFLRNNNIKH